MPNFKLKLKIITFSLVIFFGILFFPGISFAATYYVDQSHPQASDSNLGSENLPWKTIQKAANTVTAGDTVRVKSGTYDERVINPANSGSAGNKITYISYPRRTVYMKGFRWDNPRHYIRIEGFNITYPYGGWLGGGIFFDGNYIDIVDNYFHDIHGIAILPTWQDGRDTSNVYVGYNHIYKCNKGVAISKSNWIVEYNDIERLVYYNEDADYMRFFGNGHIIRNNYLHGTLVEDLGLPESEAHVDAFQTFSVTGVGTATNIIIENNIIHGFINEGLMASGYQGSHDGITLRNNIFSSENTYSWGICAEGIYNLKVYNNVFADGYSYGVGFRVGAGTTYSTGEVKNNIFYGAQAVNYWKEPGCTMDGDQNLLFDTNNTIPPENYPNDIVNQDPKFVDVASKDYRLQVDSPGIDVGVTLSGFSTDRDGVSRPQGPAWDIGAYEYIGAVPPPDTTPPAAPTGVAVQ